MTRKLTLKPERLTELTVSDLDSVVAGAPAPPSRDCPDNTYYCATGHAMCSRLLCP